MSSGTEIIQTFILRSDSKKLLLFSMFGLCETCKGLDINDYILYDGNRSWKCTIQTHIVEELERKKNTQESFVYEESGKSYLQLYEQHLDLEELVNETKVEVLNLLLFRLATQNETLSSRTSCTNVNTNQFLPDAITPRKKVKSETLVKMKTGRSLVNPVHRKVNVSKGVNFD